MNWLINFLLAICLTGEFNVTFKDFFTGRSFKFRWNFFRHSFVESSLVRGFRCPKLVPLCQMRREILIINIGYLTELEGQIFRARLSILYSAEREEEVLAQMMVESNCRKRKERCPC